MGTRGNIRVHDGIPERGVVMYSHWDADTVLPQAVAKGLARGESRWGDFTYLARIIFCDLIRDDINGIAGYGLAADLRDVDGNDRVLDVNCDDQTVTYTGDWDDKSGDSVSFADFIHAH
jgi:hypothetical protein